MKKNFIVSFGLLSLFVFFIYSGISYIHGTTENKIMFIIKDLSKKNDYVTTYDSINCTGVFSIDCKVNNLKISDELGVLFNGKELLIDDISKISNSNKISSLNTINLKFKNISILNERMNYTVIGNFISLFAKNLNGNILVKYKVKNYEISKIDIEDIKIYNDDFFVSLNGLIENKDVIKFINFDLKFNNGFMHYLYNNFYITLCSDSDCLSLNKRLLGIDSNKPVVFDEFQIIKQYYLTQIINFSKTEPIINKSIVEALIKLVNEDSKEISIKISNPNNLSIVDINKNFNDYLFSGIFSSNINQSSNNNFIFGLLLKIENK